MVLPPLGLVCVVVAVGFASSFTRAATNLRTSSMSELSDVASAMEVEEDITGTSTYRGRPKLVDWRRIISVSRIRYGKRTVRIVRRADAKAGFGRRRSFALGSMQVLRQSRTVSPHNLQTPRVPGATGSASDMIAKRAREKSNSRRQNRDLLEAIRPTSIP